MKFADDPSRAITSSADDMPMPEPVIGTLVRILTRFPFSIAFLTSIGLLVSFGSAFSKPNVYRSEGMLLLRVGAREQQTPEGAINLQPSTDGSLTATGEELLLLSDPALASRVADRVGPSRVLAPADPFGADTDETPLHIQWVHSAQAWLMRATGNSNIARQNESDPRLRDSAIRTVLASRRIFVVPQTDVIVVSYVANSPTLAREVTAAHLEVLRDCHREFFSIEDRYAFVKSCLEEATEVADSARTALSERRDTDDITDYDAFVDALALSLQRLEARDKEDEIQVDALEKSLTLLDQQLAVALQMLVNPAEQMNGGSDGAAVDGISPGAIDSVQPEDSGIETLSTPFTIATAREAILAEIAARDAVAREYSPTSAYYVDQTRTHERAIVRLEAILEALVAEERQPPAGPSGPPAPSLETADLARVYTALITQRFEVEQELAGLIAAQEKRRAALIAERKRFTELRVLEPEYRRLNQVLSEAEQSVEELQQAYARTATLQLLDADERMGNLQVIREATLPIEKEGPSRLRLVFFGLLGGLAAGLGQGWLRYRTDRFLRYPAATESLLGLRIIGVVPETRAWRSFGKRLRRRRGES